MSIDLNRIGKGKDLLKHIVSTNQVRIKKIEHDKLDKQHKGNKNEKNN